MYWPLAARLGRANVFFDNGKLRAGEEWLAGIDASLDEADVLLVVIGASWADIMSERLRGDDEDYVAHEIERALERGAEMTVIPVLIDDARPPDSRSLPPSLKRLAACQVERIRHTDLREDVDGLISRLCEIAADTAHVVPSPATDDDDDGEVPPPVLITLPRESSEPEVAQGLRVSSASIQVTGEGPHVPPRIGEDTPVKCPAPDHEHYEEVAEEAQDNGIVVFLGSEVNAEDSGNLPDDRMLAQFISNKVKMGSSSWDLAEVAQHAQALKGEQRVFQLMAQGVPAGPEPGYVHRYLAGLPSRLKELRGEQRYQMIVTPKYDVALERAFTERNEKFDVVVYMGPGTGTEMAGKFMHIPWNRDPVTIDVPNEYRGLPIRRDMELERTLIVRIHGSPADPDLNLRWRDNYVVTEDHYIQYLTGSPPARLVPGQIMEKLNTASFLFLGYTMADWRLRVFLKRLWPRDRLGNGTHWAVERMPTRLEDKLCFAAGVKLYQSSLKDYVDGLDRFMTGAAGEQALS